MASLGLGARVQFQEQDFLAARTEQRQQPVRGNLRQRFGVFEVVAVLGALLFLAFGDTGTDDPVFAKPAAQLADQRGVFTPTLHQDCARAFQRGLGVGHALVGIDEGGTEHLRVQVWIGEQAISERFQPGFARDLGAGAALGLVRQVQIFQARLGIGAKDLVAEVVGELALFVDAGQHGGAAVFQLAQVGQAGFQVAQLGVVQAAGDFLAVAGNERDAGAFVQQGDGGTRLGRLGTDFIGDGLGDLLGELDVRHCFRPEPQYGKSRLWQRTAAGGRR